MMACKSIALQYSVPALARLNFYHNVQSLHRPNSTQKCVSISLDTILHTNEVLQYKGRTPTRFTCRPFSTLLYHVIVY